MSGDHESQIDREVIGGMYWDDDAGKLIPAPPSEDSLSLYLKGIVTHLAWNAIDEATFRELADGAITREDFRNILSDSRPEDGQTKGEIVGVRAGTCNLLFSKCEAAKYPDWETITRMNLSYKDYPIKETVIPIEGKHVLFSIDEDILAHGFEITDAEPDESKIALSVERFRFGDLHFDMLRLRYEEQAIPTAPNLAPYGYRAFLLDPSGMVHPVSVHDD